jgi:hypothetical protein
MAGSLDEDYFVREFITVRFVQSKGEPLDLVVLLHLME